jgi:O-antigen ligase
VTLTLPRLRLPPIPERVLVAALPVAALAVGYGLTLVATKFGSLAPLLMVGLPLAPVVLLAVLFDARVAAVGTFALIPVGTMHVGALPVQLIIVVVFGFVGLIGLRRLAAGTAPLGWAPPLWWMLALVSWALLGFPQAVDGALAIRQIAQLLGGVLYASLIVACCKSRRDVRVVAGGFLAVSLLIGLIAVTGGQQLQAQYGGSLVSGRAQAPFTQPNELGSFCAPAALLAIAVAVGGATRRVRLFAAGVALVVLAGLALSLSRGAWIGFGLGMVVLALMLAPARRVLAVLAPVLLLVSLGMGAFAPDNPQVQVIGARLKSISGEKNPYDDRPAIWAEARREVQAKPLFGFGAGTFPAASVTATSESRTTYASHAHNLFLTWGAETGLPGAGLIVATAVHAGIVASRARRRLSVVKGSWADAAVLAGASAALIAVLGQGLVDYTLRNSVIFVAAFGFLGLQLAAARVATGSQ